MSETPNQLNPSDVSQGAGERDVANRRPGRIEFIWLMALLAALDAFSIDAMLPALGDMGRDLGLANDNQRQLVITTLFLGFSLGVLVYGYLSDRYGRRLPVIAGFVVFTVASLVCIFSQSFEALLLGRILQGVGAAGPYVISVAIVRDRYDGRDMAEVMSLIMMVFIGVPMIAPFIGQFIQQLAGWRSIFIALAVYALVVLAWFYARQPETLPEEKRTPLSTGHVVATIREVLANTTTLYYLLILGFLSGAFIAYLSTAQQVFVDMYGLQGKLPVTIACLATSYGLACFTNAKLVHWLGMRKLVGYALLLVSVSSAIYSVCLMLLGANPALPFHLAYMAIVIFSFGFLFENTVTLALDPMDHIAGAAMSIITALSTLMAVLISVVIGYFLTDTVLPIASGFAMMCIISHWLHRKAITAGS